MQEAIETRIRGARKQLDTLTAFVTEPKGVFQTVDEMVRNFRETNREMVRELGVPKLLGRRAGRIRGRWL